MKRRKFISIILFFTFVIFSIGISSVKAYAELDSKRIKINNIVMNFKQIIYLDSLNGDDLTGDGSRDKPFKTVVMGFNYLNDNCREDGAIVLKDGTYDVGGIFTGTSCNLDKKYIGMKVSLLAETMGKVQFTNVGEWIVVENSPSARIKVSLYGIIFQSTIQTWYWIGGDDWMNEYYNCVFAPGYCGSSNPVSNSKVKIENCVFVGQPASYDYKLISGTSVNCASTVQYLEPNNGTIIKPLYNVSLDEHYNITSDGWEHAGEGTNPDGSVAHIGVYGGQFAWGSKVEEISGLSRLKVVLEVNEQLQLSVNNDLDENYNFTWISSDSTVAAVNNMGQVIAMKTGNAVITVRNADGSYTDYINILVVEKADNYRLAVDLNVGKSCRLTIDDYTDTVPVTWTSMNPTVATISNKGKVNAVSNGLVLMTAKDMSENIIGQIYVRVRNR